MLIKEGPNLLHVYEYKRGNLIYSTFYKDTGEEFSSFSTIKYSRISNVRKSAQFIPIIYDDKEE